jgi:hypothetical protein
MNTKKPLTLLCVQPCIPYYAWQVEVMLTNFEQLKIHEDFNVVCLFAYNKNEHDWRQKVSFIKKVEFRFSEVADFFYYQDTREYPIQYISGIRPNLIKQYLKEYPEVGKKPIFYHDCDIVFTKYPFFFFNLLEDDMNWYVSNTISYIGHNYIVSKGQDVLDKMCQIIGVHPFFIKDREEQSGGAQYLMKGVDWQFFEKMEKDCERLYKEITDLNRKKKELNPSYHELQIWCSDMWAILWLAWMRGYKTNIINELDFCWATDNVSNYNQKYIFHNAGVTNGNRNELFYKADFRDKYPFDDYEQNYDKERASYKYFELIKSIGNKSCLYEQN